MPLRSPLCRGRLRRWVAVIVGLIGVLIVLRPGSAALSSGHLSALVAAVTGSLTAIIVRKVGDTERPVVLLIYPIFGNFMIMCLVLPFVYRPMAGTDLGLVGIIAVLGPIASLLSIRSFQKAEAVIVAPMQYSQILWATMYGHMGIDIEKSFLDNTGRPMPILPTGSAIRELL